MKKSFLFCIGLLFYCGSLAQPAGVLKEEFIKIWDNASAYTLEVAEAMPEQHYGWAYPSGQLTFSAHFEHISANIAMLYKKASGESLYKDEYVWDSSTKAGLISHYKKTSQLALQGFKRLDDEDLVKKRNFGGRELPAITLFLLMRDHMTHHRAQMILYLRMKDIEAPSYRGW